MTVVPIPPVYLEPGAAAGRGGGNADAIPISDEYIVTLGKNLFMNWEHVNGWIYAHSIGAIFGAGNAVTGEIAEKVIPWVETFVGEAIKPIGGIINSVTDMVFDVGNYAIEVYDWTTNELAYVESVMLDQANWTFDVLNEIITVDIPYLYGLIAGIEPWFTDLINAGLYGVESWVIQSVANPIIEELARVDRAIRVDTFNVIDAVADGLYDAIDAVDVDLLAKIGALAATAAIAAEWIERCGKDMCSSFGPGTDLFKLFKAFEAAALLKVLMDVGNMTEADVEAKLREIAGDASRIVSTFEDVFVGGGGSLIDFGKELL